MSSSENKVEFILRDGLFFRRDVTESNLGSQESILSGLVEPAPVLIKHVTNMVGGMHMLVASTYVVAIFPITSIPFRAYMSLTGDGKQLIIEDPHHFQTQNSVRGAIIINDPWVPPPELKMFLACNFNLDARGLVSGCRVNLLARTPQGEFLSPFYPNCHDNSEMCMGSHFGRDLDGAHTIVDKAMAGYNSFYSSKMNDHLMTEQTVKMYIREVAADGTHKWVYPPINETMSNFGRITSLAWFPFVKNL